jgi:hypothetical protein
VEIPNLIQTDLLLQSRLDQRPGDHRCSPYVYEYYEVLPFVALKSLHRSRSVRIFMTLRSALSASSSTFVRERNPRVRYTRVWLNPS